MVQPNELARESAQIQYHLTATRTAWGIDAVEHREFTAQSTEVGKMLGSMINNPDPFLISQNR